MEFERFTLTELAQRSRVTARTVHFYIQQGLLKPAGSPGPGAKYDDGHVARLSLIRRLQREHLPLAEIRKRLDAMDDETIRVAAAEATAADATAVNVTAGHPSEPASALDYVRRLLVRDHAGAATAHHDVASSAAVADARSAAPVAAPESRRAPRLEMLVSRVEAAQPAPAGAAPQPAPEREAATPPSVEASAHAAPARAEPAPAPRAAVAERSQWERYALAPDIELHVRRPLSRDQNRRVERVLALARDIFEEELP